MLLTKLSAATTSKLSGPLPQAASGSARQWQYSLRVHRGSSVCISVHVARCTCAADMLDFPAQPHWQWARRLLHSESHRTLRSGSVHAAGSSLQARLPGPSDPSQPEFTNLKPPQCYTQAPRHLQPRAVVRSSSLRSWQLTAPAGAVLTRARSDTARQRPWPSELAGQLRLRVRPIFRFQ